MGSKRITVACLCIGLITGLLVIVQACSNKTATAAAIHPTSTILQSLTAAQQGAAVDTGWQVAVPNAKVATTNYLNPAAATGVNWINMSRSFDTAFEGITIRARYPAGGTLSTAPTVRVWGVKGSDYQSLKDADGSIEITLPSASTDQTDGTYAWTESSNEVYAFGAGRTGNTVKTAAVCAAGAVQIEISRH